SLPVQSTPTLPTSLRLPQAASETAARATTARRAMGCMRSSDVSRQTWARQEQHARPGCVALGSYPKALPPHPRVHDPFQPAHQQRERDGHGEIEEGDDSVGLEEQEAR